MKVEVGFNLFGHVNAVVKSLVWKLLPDEVVAINQQSTFFYIFKAYPESLTNKEKDQWAELQQEAMNPFQGKHAYAYRSDQGVHIWFCNQAFDGVPETALQAQLHDGMHTLEGEFFIHSQQWKNGALVSNTSKAKHLLHHEKGLTPNKVKRISHNPRLAWAYDSRAKASAKQPVFWFKVLAAVGIVFGIFILGALTVLKYQHLSYEGKNNQLSELASPLLDQRERLNDERRNVKQIENWHNRYINVPIAVAKVLYFFESEEAFAVNTLEWQEQSIKIEFKSSSVDITSLIERAQGAKDIETAAIRPHNDENTWILELSW